MFISRELRKKNIAEYLLYMWQVEDIIRANNMSLDRIKEVLVKPYNLTPEAENELVEWYGNLIEMMRLDRDDVVRRC